MLSFSLPDGGSAPLEQDNYYIQEEWAGWEDTLCFSLPAKHPQHHFLAEYLALTDKESGQRYRIISIDEGKNQTDFTAALDLSELQAAMFIGYTNGSNTAAGTIAAVLPAGWTVADRSGIVIRRTIKADGATPLDVIKQCPDTYPGLAVRFDVAARQVILTRPDNEQPSGAYFTDELNLTDRPQFKGKAREFYTRLYAMGKDGMTFADINNGKAYVECREYTDRVISSFWKDERYTNPESLLEAAQITVNKAAIPERSYECAVTDLAKIDQSHYAHLGVTMYRAVTLIDRENHKRVRHQVARYRRYPHHPEKNVVTLSTVPGTISGRVSAVYAAVNDTAGITPFSQRQAAAIERATTWLTSAGGHVIAVRDENGAWTEQLFLDTTDPATAKNVLRINANGIGFSTSGIGGPYQSAWTIDGKLVIDDMLTGTLDASQITVINLIAEHLRCSSGEATLDIQDAMLQLLNGTALAAQLTLAADGTAMLQLPGGTVSAATVTVGETSLTGCAWQTVTLADGTTATVLSKEE